LFLIYSIHVNRICQTSTASIVEVEKTEFHLQLEDLVAPMYCLQYHYHDVQVCGRECVRVCTLASERLCVREEVRVLTVRVCKLGDRDARLALYFERQQQEEQKRH